MAPNSRFAVAVHLATSMAWLDGETVPSEALARSVNTNPVVVRRILGRLARARLVAPHPGAAGGYTLARDPAEITLRDVYRAVEGEGLFALHANPEARQCPVSCTIKGLLAGVFQSAEDAVETTLGKTTLADLVTRVRRREGLARR